jgi:ribosomal protein L29
MNKHFAEFSGLDYTQLIVKINELENQLLQLRLQVATTHVKNFSSQKTALKQSIARGLTKLTMMNGTNNG